MSDSGQRFDFDFEEDGPGIPAQLRDPLGVWRRSWRWSTAAFVLLIIPAVVVSSLIPLEFEAASRLMMSSKAIPDEFVADTIVASGSEQFQVIQNRVLTRSNLKEIVQSHEAFAEDRNSTTLDALVGKFRNDIEVETKTVLSASRRESSTEIRVSLRGEEPQHIADLVNLITGNMIDEFLAYRSEQSKVTSTFMQREFERADEALREHQRTLAAFRAQHRGSLPEEQLATIGKLERLESQRRSMILQLNDARAQLANGDVVPSRDGIPLSPRERMRIELDDLLRIYTEDHPQVQSLQRQLAALEETGISEAGAGSTGGGMLNSRRTLLEEIAARRTRLDEIDAEVAHLESKVAQTSGITEEYRALERKEEVLQESYTDYLRKLQTAELARSMEDAQQGTQLARLESAIPPTSPVMPRVLFVAAAVVFALVGSLLVAVARELLNPVVIDAAHLEQITSLPTLGSIPRVSGMF
jgi:uncharacterized protein involved in exopolysaccharide biosynthesis